MAKKAYVRNSENTEWVELASATTDLTNYANLTTTPVSGFRNAIINGDFRIWQRGTTGVTATNNATGYVADRWQTYRAAYAAGVNVSQVSSTGLINFNYALRNQRVSGNTSTAAIAIVNNFESENSIPLAGKTITLSAWIRVGADFSGTLAMGPYTGTGIDQRRASGFTGASSVMTTISPTTSWARYTATATLNSDITQASVWFNWTPSGTAGTNDWIDITGVQLELGNIATPFEQRPIGTEITLCQRYYEKSYDLNTTPGTDVFAGTTYVIYNANSQSSSIHFKVSKRAQPQIILYTRQGAINTWTIAQVGSFSSSGANVGENSFLASVSGASSGQTVGGHWVASAEL